MSFKFKDSFSISKQTTIITIIMSTQTKFCVSFSKINIKLFSGYPKLPLIPKVCLVLKNYSCDLQNEMINYYQHHKLKHSQQCHYQNSKNLHYQMLFRIILTYMLFCIHTFLYYFFYYITCSNKQLLNLKLLLGFLGQEFKL